MEQYAAASGDEVYVKNRDILERRFGPEATLAAQQRSKQILKEIEAAKRAATSSAPKDLGATISPPAETPRASGSGTIVSTEGHVLTAAHVVAGASRVKIFTAQGMKMASVLRIDQANDLAVLKLAEGTYPAMPVGKPDRGSFFLRRCVFPAFHGTPPRPAVSGQYAGRTP